MADDPNGGRARTDRATPVAWWGRRSLRARITVVSTVLFTIMLIIAGVALLVTIGRSLVNTLDSSAERTGTEVAALVKQGKLPQQLFAGSGGVSFVQVVDGQNRVVAGSAGEQAVSILPDDQLARARLGNPINVSGARASSDSPVRVVGVKADIPAGQRTVLVATDYGRVLESSRVLQRSLLFGAPVAVAMMAALTWWIVGRTLRPVAELRRGAAELSAAGLAQSRLPVPSADDEIHSLATTLNDMLDRLDAATSKQRRFVGDAAHELRSPIASLRVQLEVAALVGPPEMKELTHDALIDVDRLAHLIDDLLTLARSDERGGLASREPVELGKLLESVVANYAGARVPVVLRPDGLPAGREPITVIGDEGGLHRVLVNLIDNGVRYASTAVQVGVSRPAAGGTEDRGSQAPVAIITVSDDGPGIPADKRERVFDRFYRVDPARSRAAGGTGLGLAIVREIVTAHGGTITLDDNNPGLLVQVRLPIVERTPRN